MKILVADDGASYRLLLSRIFQELPEVSEVQTASSVQECLQKLDMFAPDILALDPEMNKGMGYDVFRKLKARKTGTLIVIVTQPGSSRAKEMFAEGDHRVLDLVDKPAAFEQVDALAVKKWLARAVQSVLFRREIRKGLDQAKDFVPAAKTSRAKLVPESSEIRLVGIGISTGGPDSLSTMLPLITKKPSFPIVIVQHMPAVFTRVLAETLSDKCIFPVSEATDQEVLLNGHVYIAPGAKQTSLVQLAGSRARVCFRVTDEPPVNNCKPSIDHFFQSVVGIYGASAAAFVMTGMGDDGSKGLLALKGAGARTFAQDAATSVVFGMPSMAIETGAADEVLSLPGIAQKILTWCK